MMVERKEDNYSLLDIFGSVKSFFYYLRKKWPVLLVAVCLGAGLGVLYYFIQKPKYKAVSTFILEEKSSGSGLAGLASQFGFNIGPLNSGSTFFSGDNILNILKSKKVVEHVLLSYVSDTSDNGKTLADLYLDFSRLKKNWQAIPYLKDVNFADVAKPLSPLQDSVLNAVYEKIVDKNLVTERISKQGTIIRVQVTAADACFARLMAERLIADAGKLYLDIRTGTARENIRQLQRRSDSLLMLLNNKSYTAAYSQPLDINPGIRTAVVPVEIANRDKTVLATLYAEVTKNLEASKLLLSQQMPVMQMLDRPDYLLKDNRKSLPLLLILGLMGGTFLYFLGAFFIFQLSRVRPEKN